MRLSVVDGQVWVEHGSGDVAARLEWDPATVRVRLDGALVEGHACDVATGTSITAEAIDVEPTIRSVGSDGVHDVNLRRDDVVGAVLRRALDEEGWRREHVRCARGATTSGKEAEHDRKEQCEGEAHPRLTIA